MKNFIKELIYRLRGEYTTEKLVTMGMTVGKNFKRLGGVILPGVTVGNDVIIGANSTVTHDIPDKTVVAGSPARVICSLDDYLNKERERMKASPCYGEEYTMRQNVSIEMKMRQKKELDHKIGYID